MSETRSQGRASSLVVGVGSSRGVEEQWVLDALRSAVPEAYQVHAYATVDRRRDEPGLLAGLHAFAPRPLWTYPVAELDAEPVPHPSAAVRAHVGSRSVAEAAALRAARDLGGGELVVPKYRGRHVTVAVVAVVPLTISAACTACGACLLTCPERALRPAPGRPVVLGQRCTSCGECVEICPIDAITLTAER